MAPALFISRRLTDPGEYTKQIEGPAVDAAGTLFVKTWKSTTGVPEEPSASSVPAPASPVLWEGENGIHIDRFENSGLEYPVRIRRSKLLPYRREIARRYRAAGDTRGALGALEDSELVEPRASW
jgi:hypothetical protein